MEAKILVSQIIGPISLGHSLWPPFRALYSNIESVSITI
uniref:Uncharacterized protein n=1 Tax=Rhizophora mucronata TaxID=61149 RepID=A0A2P2NJ46_RHIMU